jgi:hypothetical protein
MGYAEQLYVEKPGEEGDYGQGYETGSAFLACNLLLGQFPRHLALHPAHAQHPYHLGGRKKQQQCENQKGKIKICAHGSSGIRFQLWNLNIRSKVNLDRGHPYVTSTGHPNQSGEVYSAGLVTAT